MYSPLGKINDSIIASLCETDITDWYREERESSLFWKLFQYESFWHHEDFELTIKSAASAIQIADKLINIEPDTQKIYVPPVTVACYPTTKISTWRKHLNLDTWLRNGIKSFIRTMDCEAVNMLIAADTNLVCEKNHQSDIMIMSPSTCERKFGITVDSINSHKAYVIPKRGQVPVTVKEEIEEPKSEWVVELEHDNKRLFVTDVISNDKIITCGHETLGIICSRKQVFALPVPEPKKLRVGAVLSHEFGICIYDTSGYSVLTEPTGFSS